VEQVRPHVRRGSSAPACFAHARDPSLALAPRRGVRDPQGGVANINGEQHYLWRAVDHEGEVLESYVTRKRDKAAALAFLKKALKRHGRAETIVTDGMRSYQAAMRELGNVDRREIDRWMNNWAENSHLPFRRGERAMQRFRRMKSLQKFASVHASLHNHFNQERHLTDRQTYKERRSAALAEWQPLAA
jgi:putative transposase